MPTYEFRCPRGHEFEKFYRAISVAESQAVCPVCGEASERMMSAAGFAFKGSGFYLTDYGKNAHRTEGDLKTSNARSEASEKGGTKSETPAAESSGGETPSAPPAAAPESAKPEVKKAEPKTEAKASTPAAKPSSGE